MSIGLNEVTSGSALLVFTDLHGAKFPNDLDADSFLTSIWNVTDVIWSNVDQTYYTNHDLRHSVKIIDYFLKLTSLYHWSNYERLVFATAALIHDIGMQYNQWASPASETKLHAPYPLPPDDERKRHAELGYELVMAQVNDKYDFPFPPRFCDTNSFGPKNALARAAKIAYSHSEDKYLNSMISDHNYVSRTLSWGDLYRPRVLAGMLRLCDELDGNAARIVDPDRLYTSAVNDESKAHWLACLFVEEIELSVTGIDEDFKGATINLRWQVPEGATEKQINEIRTFLSRIRIARIANEIEVVREFLGLCKEDKYIKEFNVNPLQNQHIDFHFKIPANFSEIIRNASSTRYAPLGKPADTPDLSQGDSAISRNANRYYVDRFDLSIMKMPLQERLRIWFEQNKIVGHFELINNQEHTDVFLHCRSLVSDQELLRAIADHISTSHMDHNIECVLAVGTSAIPLATNVAYRLQCAVSFTVSTKKKYARRQDYYPGEALPSTLQGENLLIIDDVISGGRVAAEVLESLANVGRPPGTVYHHSIFRLGNRDYIRDPRVEDYLWIQPIPEVLYADKDSCPLCARHEKLRKESEMY